MTLAQLLSQPPADIATLRGLWLAFDAAFSADLDAAQADQAAHRAAPLTLTDGRLALCADLLSEIGEGGIFALQFSRLDASKFADVAVLDDATFRALLPEPETE